MRLLVVVSLLALAANAAAQSPPPGVHTPPVTPPTLNTTPETVELPSGPDSGGEEQRAPEEPSHEDDVLHMEPTPGSRIQWNPAWPQYRVDELVLTGGMALVIGLAEFLPTGAPANWSGATELDVAAADALGLDTPQQRTDAGLASDVFVGVLLMWPVLIDSLLFTGLVGGAWDVAWQLSMISLEAIVINHALNIAIKLLSRRERPINAHCADPAYAAMDSTCADPPPPESFWSGHVSNSFAAAALVCLHHDMLDIFGNEIADGSACGGAVALALTVAYLRTASDRHWVTDVIMGAAVGTLTGALIPYFLHFIGGAIPPLRGQQVPPLAFAPMVGEDTYGVTAIGLW